MKSPLTKNEAQEKINLFFAKQKFTPEEMKKTRRLAMKYKIKLGHYRKKFCKKCLSQLKGKTRILKTHKTIICENCNFKNKFKLS